MTDNLESLGDRLSPQAENETPFAHLSALGAVLSAIPDRTLLLDRLLQAGRRFFVADHGAILSHHKPTGRWFVEAQHGLGDDAVEEIKGISWGLIERTSAEAQGFLIPDARSHELTHDSPSVRLYNILSVLTAPILEPAGVWGVIYLDNTCIPRAFDAESRRALAHFAEFAGTAIQCCDRLLQSSQGGTQRGDLPACGPLLADFADARMREVTATLQRAAGVDASVLLLGETGTGKDVLARWVHEQSPRRHGPFLTVDCTNLAEGLVESELFGIESNVATGVKFREGKLKLADGGTVLFNEVGELPLSMQAKLLHAIQYKEVVRVGGRAPIGVDVRYLFATHRNLAAMVEEGSFRQDLFYRINLVTVTIPPLRDRRADISQLAQHLLDEKCRLYRHRPMRIPQPVMKKLVAMPWEGNVRELANVLERAVIMSDSAEFQIDVTSPVLVPSVPIPTRPGRWSMPDAIRKLETQYVLHALNASGWVRKAAAARLGIPESTLGSMIKRLQIKRPPRAR